MTIDVKERGVRRTTLRGLLITAGFLSCCFAPAIAAASPGTTAPQDQLTLNSYFNWRKDYTPPVKTSQPLTAGEYYVATVSGTFSYYPAYLYVRHYSGWKTVCGAPASSPRGPVGMDAQFIFARPWTFRGCRHHSFPQPSTNFRASTDLVHWAHPAILQPLSAPDSDHTYSYALVGAGHPAGFRLKDGDTRDNYGKLTIDVRVATASDCAGYQAFGFADAADCSAALSLQ